MPTSFPFNLGLIDGQAFGEDQLDLVEAAITDVHTAQATDASNISALSATVGGHTTSIGTNATNISTQQGRIDGLLGSGNSIFRSVILGRVGIKNILTSTPTSLDGFTAETRDDGAFHSTVTNNDRITVPAGLGGLYLISYQIRYAAGTSGFRMAWVDLNGSGLSDQRLAEQAQTSATAGTLSGFTIFPLAAGDYIRVILYCTGAAINFGDGTLADRFSAVRLCA